MIAVSLKEGEELVNLFLQKGADVNAKSKSLCLILILNKTLTSAYRFQRPSKSFFPFSSILDSATPLSNNLLSHLTDPSPDSTPLRSLQSAPRHRPQIARRQTSRLNPRQRQTRPVPNSSGCCSGQCTDGGVVCQA
jgi:hypothetical protein